MKKSSLRSFAGSRHSTPGPAQRENMVKVAPSFMNETIWPEYQALHKTLEAHLEEVTQRVVAQALHADTSDISPSTPK
jgi:hypothetical protein